MKKRCKFTFYVQILRVSYLHLTALCVQHVRSLDGIVMTIDPKHVFRSRIEVDVLYPLLVGDHFDFVPFVELVRANFWSIRKQNHRVVVQNFTNSAVIVGQLETLPARAGVGAVHVRANLGTLMLTGGTLVDVLAMLPIVL